MNTDKNGRVLAEAVSYFVGLDLGQSRDHSALAVVERADLILDEIEASGPVGRMKREDDVGPVQIPQADERLDESGEIVRKPGRVGEA